MKGRVSSSLLLVLALVAFGSSNSPVVRAQDTADNPLASLEEFVGPLLDELSVLINSTDIGGVIDGLTSGDLANVNITETLETLGDGLQDILGGLGLNFTNILDGGLGDLLQGLNLNISQILDEVDLGNLGIDGLDGLDIGQVVNGALSCNWTQLTPQIDTCVSSLGNDTLCTAECSGVYETLQKECPTLIEPLSAILPTESCGLTPPTTDTTPVVPSSDTTPVASPSPQPSGSEGITKGEEDGTTTVPQVSSAPMASGMIVATLGSILVAAVMNQYVNVSLSLLGLCGIVGAGVAIGSGVGMMALNVAQDQQEEGKQESVAVVAAHSPVETKGSFAARGVSGAEH